MALAQEEKSTWSCADLVKYLGRVLPRSGPQPRGAAALLEDLADRALRSEFEPVLCWRHPTPWRCHAACCVPTGAASISGTGACGTPRARLAEEERMLVQARASGAPRLTRADAARAFGAEPEHVVLAVAQAFQQ